jgi:hypothetical protein
LHPYPAGFLLHGGESQDPPPVDPGSYPEYGIVVRTVVVRMVVRTVIGMVVGVSVPTPSGLLDNPEHHSSCSLIHYDAGIGRSIKILSPPADAHEISAVPGGDYERSDPLRTRDPFQGNLLQRSHPRNPFIREMTNQGIFIVPGTDNVITE